MTGLFPLTLTALHSAHYTPLHYNILHNTTQLESRGSLVISPGTMEHELFSLSSPGQRGWGSLIRKNIDCNVPLLLEYSTRVKFTMGFVL